MSWDPIHNFLDMVCSGGGKKARKRWKEAEKRDRDVRAKRHIVTDPNIGWGRHGAVKINPDADGGFNFEHTVEDRDGSIKNFRVNIDPGFMQQGEGPMPVYRRSQEIVSQGLSEQALALGAMARNSSGGWAQRSPLPTIPQMRPFGSGLRFGFRPEGFQEDGRTAPPPYMTEDPRFRPGFGTFQERSRNLRSTYNSREPRDLRSSRSSAPNLRQHVSSDHAQESGSRSTHRGNPRSPTRSHSTRRSESEARSRSQQTGEPSHIPVSEVSNTSTLRVRTSQAPLGDMSRTFVEGMVPIEEEERPRPL